MSQPTGTQGSADPTGAQSGTGAEGTATTDPNASATGQTGAQGANEGQQGNEGQQTDVTKTPEYQALMRRMQASDQNNAKIAAELKALQDKDLGEVEKLKRDHGEAQQKITTLIEENRVLQLQLAFVGDNTYTWHNPNAALKLADLSDVKVSESGAVTGLKEALKAVADANPWMLKQQDGEGTGTTAPTGRTGVPSGAGKQDAGKANRTALVNKYPGLRSRGITG